MRLQSHYFSKKPERSYLREISLATSKPTAEGEAPCFQPPLPIGVGVGSQRITPTKTILAIVNQLVLFKVPKELAVDV